MEHQKIKDLVEKYNDVLLESMKNAIAEDLFNLMIVNKDDESGELRDLIAKKTEFKKMVLQEFLRYNSSSVSRMLSSMEEKKLLVQGSNSKKKKKG